MYKNVGHKIKFLADQLCVLGMLIFGIYGIYFFQTNIILGIVIIALGCFGCWVGSLFMYGFGELIDETTANRENTDRIIDILESQYEHDHAPQATMGSVRHENKQ